MSHRPLPPSGLASDLLAQLPPVDPADPRRLATFVEAVGQPAVAPVSQPEATSHLVAFSLAEELFAFPVDRVREIVRVQALTRVPQAPEHVRGVQSLRGAVLPVLEIKTRLGMPEVALGHTSRIIVAESGNRLLGLLVDAVLRVVRLPRSEISPPPAEVRSRLSEHIVGVARVDGRVALLLDIDRLLVLPSSVPEVSKS